MNAHTKDKNVESVIITSGVAWIPKHLTVGMVEDARALVRKTNDIEIMKSYALVCATSIDGLEWPEVKAYDPHCSGFKQRQRELSEMQYCDLRAIWEKIQPKLEPTPQLEGN